MTVTRFGPIASAIRPPMIMPTPAPVATTAVRSSAESSANPCACMMVGSHAVMPKTRRSAQATVSQNRMVTARRPGRSSTRRPSAPGLSSLATAGIGMPIPSESSWAMVAATGAHEVDRALREQADHEGDGDERGDDSGDEDPAVRLAGQERRGEQRGAEPAERHAGHHDPDVAGTSAWAGEIGDEGEQRRQHDAESDADDRAPADEDAGGRRDRVHRHAERHHDAGRDDQPAWPDAVREHARERGADEHAQGGGGAGDAGERGGQSQAGIFEHARQGDPERGEVVALEDRQGEREGEQGPLADRAGEGAGRGHGAILHWVGYERV